MKRRSLLSFVSLSMVDEQKLDEEPVPLDDDLFDDWSLGQSNSAKTNSEPEKENLDDDLLPDTVKWISADVHDDGPEYRERTFDHSETLFKRFHSLFGLKRFRSNQQEAIHCALERRFHVFVLMPTGEKKKHVDSIRLA